MPALRSSRRHMRSWRLPRSRVAKWCWWRRATAPRACCVWLTGRGSCAVPISRWARRRRWANASPSVCRTPFGSPPQTLRVQTDALAGTLVEEGLGYAFVDGFTAASLDLERVAMLRPVPPISFDLCAMRNAGTQPSLLVDQLQECLRQAANRAGARLSGALTVRSGCPTPRRGWGAGGNSLPRCPHCGT